MPDEIIFIGNVSRMYFEKHASYFYGLVTFGEPISGGQWSKEQLKERGDIAAFYNMSEYKRRMEQNV